VIKKQIKWIVIGVIALAVAIGALLLIEKIPDQSQQSSVTTLPEYGIGIVGYERNHARDDIEVMTLVNPDRTLHLRPLNDGEYIESQKWTIDEFSGRESSKWAVNDLALNFYYITARDVLRDIPASELYRYGLDDPKNSITIRFLDGNEFTYRFGAKTPVGGTISGYYVMRDDDPNVYIVEEYYYNELQVGLPDLIGLYITGELDDQESISEISMYGPGYAEDMMLTYVPEEERDPTTGSMFRFTTPFTRDADDRFVLEMVDALYYLDAYSVAEAYDKALPADVLAEYGLTTPSKTISYVYKGERTTLKVGKVDGSYAYIIYNEEPIIYQVAYADVKVWYEMSVEKLAVRTIYIANINKTESISFDTSFKPFDIKISLQGESANGATMNGKRINMGDFREFFADMIAITYIERADSPAPTGKADMSITYNMRDGSTVKVEFFKVSARRYHAVVNGRGGVLVSYDDVDSILDGLISLDKTDLT